MVPAIKAMVPAKVILNKNPVILVPFGDNFSKTNVLFFAQINVLSA